ncbi:MAG: hypothetical protein KBT76_15355 [Sulfitobacter litoralis]|nr:hypothetical protein [Sulfitobacter litoralis]
MSELPKKIMVWHGPHPLPHAGSWATTRYPMEAEEYVRASALPDMVKPLEWGCTDWSAGDGIKGENDCEWTAEIWPMTSYIISWFGGERFEINTPLDEKLTATSLEAAKEAAQAHHTAAILSAFGVQGGEV